MEIPESLGLHCLAGMTHFSLVPDLTIYSRGRAYLQKSPESDAHSFHLDGTS